MRSGRDSLQLRLAPPDSEVKLKMSKHAGLRAVCFRSMKIGFQSIHLLLALLLAVMAVLGFAAAPSMFDLLESYGNPGAHAINGGPSFLRVRSEGAVHIKFAITFQETTLNQL